MLRRIPCNNTFVTNTSIAQHILKRRPEEHENICLQYAGIKLENIMENLETKTVEQDS